MSSFVYVTSVLLGALLLCHHFECGIAKTTELQLTEYLDSVLNKTGYALATAGSRPVKTSDMILEVDLIFHLAQIIKFDEKDQTLVTSFLKEFTWKNDLMTWDPASYGGVKSIRYPRERVWIPDIILLNGISSLVPSTSAVEFVKVDNDGNTHYYEPVIYTSSCFMDMWNFPYDTQHCKLTWGSWSYSTERLKLHWPSKKMYLQAFLGDQEWELQSTHISGGTGPDMKEKMTYQFYLKRIPNFYVQMILVPTFLLAILVVSVFWIPPSRPDRTNLGMGVFAGFMLLLLLVVNIAPPSTNMKLGLYYCINIVMVVMSTVLSGVVVAMSSKEIQMSDKWREIFVFKLGKWLKILDQYEFLMKFGTSLNASIVERRSTMQASSQGMDQRRVDHAHRMRLIGKRDWQVAAVVIDRFLFVIYVILVFAILIAFFPWPISNGKVTEPYGAAPGTARPGNHTR